MLNNFVIQSLNKNCMTIEWGCKLIIGDNTEYLNESHDIKYKNMVLGWNKNANKIYIKYRKDCKNDLCEQFIKENAIYNNDKGKNYISWTAWSN